MIEKKVHAAVATEVMRVLRKHGIKIQSVNVSFASHSTHHVTSSGDITSFGDARIGMTSCTIAAHLGPKARQDSFGGAIAARLPLDAYGVDKTPKKSAEAALVSLDAKVASFLSSLSEAQRSILLRAVGFDA
jgi:hypothetical protein